MGDDSDGDSDNDSGNDGDNGIGFPNQESEFNGEKHNQDYQHDLRSMLETQEAYQLGLDYRPQDSSSIPMDISDGPTPTPALSPDGERPTWIAEKIVSMLRSNGHYSLFREMYDIDNLGLEITENLPSTTPHEIAPLTDNNELSLPSSVQLSESTLPTSLPSEPISVERLLENMHILDAAPHPPSSAPYPDAESPGDAPTTEESSSSILTPRTPYVLNMKHMAKPEDRYQHIHTAAERQFMYCGHGPEENSDSRVRVDVELDAQSPSTFSQSFDVDSFVGQTTSLAVSRHGITFYPQQRSVPNITTSFHLTPRQIRLTDEQQKEHLLTFDICDIPNWLLGSLAGSSWLTINVFFPGLVEYADNKRRGDGQGRHLRHVDFRQFFDLVFLPSVVRAVSVVYSQSYPKSANHARANSRARYQELRTVKLEALPQHQNLGYQIPASALPAIQAHMERLVNALDLKLTRFRNFFFVIHSKGTKLDHRKSLSWDTTSERFQTWLADNFHMEHFDHDSTFLDLGKATVPSHTSIDNERDPQGLAGQSLFWRQPFVEKFFPWLNDQSTDGYSFKPTIYPWVFLKGVCSGTAETKPKSQLRKQGLLYVQLYNSFKDITAAADTYAFSNRDLENISLSPRILKGLQKVANAVSCNIDTLIAGYIAARQRCDFSLRASEEASSGVREEYRMSLTLFFQVDRLMREQGPINCPPPANPTAIGWIALATGVTIAWYRWNLNKFNFAFELIHSINHADWITFDHTRTMIMFIQLIHSFLGCHNPNRYPSIWKSLLSTERDGRFIRHGLGVRDNMTSFGYGWINNVLDWETMTIAPTFSRSMDFERTTLSGVYKKNYGLFRHTYDDLIATHRASCWLRDFGSVPECRTYILEYLQQLCLRAFRRDVFNTLKKSLNSESVTRSQAVSGKVPLSHYALSTSLTGRGATHITITNAPNQKIRRYSELFAYLWEPDASPRGPWASKGYRMLYQECQTTIHQHSSPAVVLHWKDGLRDHLRVTHWLLPYPDLSSLVSKHQKTGQYRWWSNYDKAVDEFNCSYTGETQFLLPASVRHEWPTAAWADVTAKGTIYTMLFNISPLTGSIRCRRRTTVHARRH